MKNEEINELYNQWLIPEGRVRSVISREFEKMEQQIVNLEAQLAEARRHNELLRAVAEAGRFYLDASVCDPDITAEMVRMWDVYCAAVQAAIDGGALEVE